ncbi:MAG: hypothetical protein V2I33_21800 [Kangiellaceae bacterium]|nr:hypothetical protein [Kangiellaceae bacterium]
MSRTAGIRVGNRIRGADRIIGASSNSSLGMGYGEGVVSCRIFPEAEIRGD